MGVTTRYWSDVHIEDRVLALPHRHRGDFIFHHFSIALQLVVDRLCSELSSSFLQGFLRFVGHPFV